MDQPPSALKQFLGNWLLPPKIFDAAIQYRTRRSLKISGTTSWRYWDGEPLPSPVVNVPLFLANGFKPQSITFNRECRDSIALTAGAETKLQIFPDRNSLCRIGFGLKGKPKHGETIEVFLDAEQVARLDYVVPGEWHDIWFKVPAGKHTVTFRHSCSGSVFTSHPVFQFSAEKKGTGLRNVIILLCDALVRDCIGLYSDKPSRTPNIDRLFSKGLTLTNAFSQSEWTFPAFHSIFTSRYPMGHGSNYAKSPGGGLPSEGCNSLAEEMRALGYTTMGYSAMNCFSPAYNSHVGYDRFLYHFYWKFGQPTHSISRLGISQLEANRDGKNFLFLHYMESHPPFLERHEKSDFGLSNFRVTDPTAEFFNLLRGHGETKGVQIFDDKGVETISHRRDIRMAELDLTVSELLDYLDHTGQADDTLVVLLSDHGMPYLQQNQPLLCPTRLHVPVLLKGPGVPAGIHKGMVAANLDIMPTILQLAGGKLPLKDGVAIAPIGKTERTHVLSESLYAKTYQAAVRDDEMVYHFRCAFDSDTVKVHANERVETKLFLRSNEKECVDVSREHPAKVKELHAVLEKHFAQNPDRIIRA